MNTLGYQLNRQHLKGARRCLQCLMHEPLCICAIIPNIETQTKVVLIVHSREIKKPSNTGGLACKALNNSQVVIRGIKDQPLDQAEIVSPDAQNIFLFPTEESIPIKTWCNSFKNPDKPVRLIVPDGNWSQAARVLRRLPGSSLVQPVNIPIGEPSEYMLRKEPLRRPEGMATLEAIARTLELLEPGLEIKTRLMEIFRIMRDRTLWTKGKLPS
jgi:DTW domain-containing protein